MIGHLCTWGEQCPLLKQWHSTMKRRVRVYDNRGESVDRYEVQISRIEKGARVWDIYNMSDNPLAPDGFNQYNYTCPQSKHERSRVMGVRVNVQDLPKDVITAIEHRI